MAETCSRDVAAGKGILTPNQLILMEQVAMYMAALPCPPMPLMLSDSDGPQYCNSHDFIASLLLNAMALGNVALNEERKRKQVELTNQLLSRLALLSRIEEASKKEEAAYTHFSEFTAGYICAFASIDVGVTFLPLADVASGDTVHKACCSWDRAQRIILKEEKDQEQERSYKDLLMAHCRRFSEAECSEKNSQKAL